MAGSRRYRYTALRFDLAITYYPRGHPIPGLDVELETPAGTIGGYIHA